MAQITWPIIASYIYVIVWSVSFYGQIYENQKNKSVEGLSMNYFLMNISGYTLYTMYSTIGFFTDIEGAGTVVLADILFVFHAVVCLTIQTIQVLCFPKGKNKPSRICLLICMGVWVFMILEIVLTVMIKVIPETQFWNPVSCMGYGKLFLTVSKCFPAIYWNYKRQSTVGWSIHGVLLDFVGGVFSFLSASFITNEGVNVTKLALGIFSFVVDGIFMFQHYVLYRKPRQQPLLQH